MGKKEMFTNSAKQKKFDAAVFPVETNLWVGVISDLISLCWVLLTCLLLPAGDSNRFLRSSKGILKRSILHRTPGGSSLHISAEECFRQVLAMVITGSIALFWFYFFPEQNSGCSLPTLSLPTQRFYSIPLCSVKLPDICRCPLGGESTLDSSPAGFCQHQSLRWTFTALDTSFSVQLHLHVCLMISGRPLQLDSWWASGWTGKSIERCCYSTETTQHTQNNGFSRNPVTALNQPPRFIWNA